MQLRSTRRPGGRFALPPALAARPRARRPATVTVRVEGAEPRRCSSDRVTRDRPTPVNSRHGGAPAPAPRAGGALERATGGDWAGTGATRSALQRRPDPRRDARLRPTATTGRFWVNGKRRARTASAATSSRRATASCCFVDRARRRPRRACETRRCARSSWRAPASAQTGCDGHRRASRRSAATAPSSPTDRRDGSPGGGSDATTGRRRHRRGDAPAAGRVTLKATKPARVRSAAEQA